MRGRINDPLVTDYWVAGSVGSSQVSQLLYADQPQPIAYLLVPDPPPGFSRRPVYAPVQPQPEPRRPGFG